MSYKYVAFLDVMGYKEYLERDIQNGRQDFKDKLNAAFRVFESVDSSDINYKSISDSIFISVSSEYNVCEFFNLLKNIWIEFLKHGMLLRGGVSYDEHFENTHITYSKALTDAYNIENSRAFFPRIVINENIFEVASSYKEAIKTQNIIIKSGNDYIINVITEENVEDIYEAFKQIVEENKETIYKSAQIRSRYLWLQNYIIFKNSELEICISEWNEAF